jgi:hypothetical protein
VSLDIEPQRWSDDWGKDMKISDMMMKESEITCMLYKMEQLDV